jgi:hypothetical protein
MATRFIYAYIHQIDTIQEVQDLLKRISKRGD